MDAIRYPIPPCRTRLNNVSPTRFGMNRLLTTPKARLVAGMSKSSDTVCFHSREGIKPFMLEQSLHRIPPGVCSRQLLHMVLLHLPQERLDDRLQLSHVSCINIGIRYNQSAQASNIT